MKKLFTLAAAVLTSFSLFAADYEPTTVYTVGDAETLGANWQDKGQKQAYFEVDDAVIFSPYVAYASQGNAPYQSWTGSVGGNSAKIKWDAQDIFKGSAAWFNNESDDARQASVRPTRHYLYNVTNCTEVHALVKAVNSSTTITLAAYEIVEGVVSTEAAKSATYTETVNGVVSITGLNANKTYRIKLDSNTDSNSSFYEIAFVKPASVTYTVTYIANNGTDEADVVDPAASKIAACTFTAPANTEFGVWNTKADGTGDNYKVGDAVESDLELYAQWYKSEYVTIYDLAAGIGSAEVTADNAAVSEESLVMTNSAGRITLTPKAGYSFKNGDLISFAGTVGNASKPFGIKIGSQTLQTEDVTPVNPEAPTGTGTASVEGALALSSDAATIAIGRAGGTTTTLTSLVIKQKVTVTPTAVENAEVAEKAVKVIENGQLVIIKNGVKYNAQGIVVR